MSVYDRGLATTYLASIYSYKTLCLLLQVLQSTEVLEVLF